MMSTIPLQPSTSKLHRETTVKLAGTLTLTSSHTNNLRITPRRFIVSSLHASQNVSPPDTSQPSIASHFTSSVGSPPLIRLSITQRHFTVLQVAACAVAISATWLFCAAIPTLLAFKRAAESLEKLLDVTREELPDTMAAVRLSGMEISDLTTELSDLGQELTQGVKSSTNAVRVAEERLRQFTNMTSRAPMQEVISCQPTTAEPEVARTVRGIREGIVKGRGVLAMVFALTRFSTSIFNYFKKSRKQALNK